MSSVLTEPRPASFPGAQPGESRPAGAWVVYTLLFSSACIIVGLLWDISWHMSIGRDKLWSPPHVLEQMRSKIERQFHYVERPDAMGYSDGAVWELGGTRVRAIHMPGHTSGHCVLLVEPEGVAFIGDIDLSSFGPYYGDATSSLEQFRHTLRAVRNIPASAWVTSHHKGVITERATFVALLETFAAKLEARENAIAAHLTARPSTLDELVVQRFVYPRGYEDVFIDAAERRTIAQHLASLLRAGRIAEDAGRFHLAS